MTPTLYQGQADELRQAAQASRKALDMLLLYTLTNDAEDAAREALGLLDAALAATHAPTADLRAEIASLRCPAFMPDRPDIDTAFEQGFLRARCAAVELVVARHAAAQLAAVAAPEARIEKQEMGNQAAGDRTGFAAPLSEPCALDQGARPARLSDEQIEVAARTLADVMDYPWEHMPMSGRERMRQNARKVIEAGIAPPVAQPGSTK